MSDSLTSSTLGEPDAAKLIAGIAAAYRVGKGFRLDLASVSAALNRALAALGSLSNEGHVDFARGRIFDFENTSEEFAREPGRDTQNIADSLTEALRSTGEAIVTQLPNGADRKPVEELIGQGRYLDAANSVRLTRSRGLTAEEDAGLDEANIAAVSQTDITVERHSLAAFLADFSGPEIHAERGDAILTLSQAPSTAGLRAQTLRRCSLLGLSS